MIDVRKEMNLGEKLFIKDKGVDKSACAVRYAVTEKIFHEWFDEINRTNTRELPNGLVQEYENACIALCKILTKEKELILKD